MGNIGNADTANRMTPASKMQRRLWVGITSAPGPRFRYGNGNTYGGSGTSDKMLRPVLLFIQIKIGGELGVRKHANRNKQDTARSIVTFATRVRDFLELLMM
jgi:hypothetical protein